MVTFYFTFMVSAAMSLAPAAPRVFGVIGFVMGAVASGTVCGLLMGTIHEAVLRCLDGKRPITDFQPLSKGADH